jgi:DNA-binding response OmpR family regulator
MLILLAEDDRIIASGLEYALTQEGYEVAHCGDVASAMAVAEARELSLGLLDIGLPDGTGYQLCRKLREKGVPVIFLTAVDDEANTVMGLEMGAEDYIAKPFRLRELLVRVKAVLRRGAGGASPFLRVTDEIQINTGKAKVFRGQEEIELTALEYRLLLVFAGNPGQVLSSGQLLEGIWDVAGSFVNDNTLTVYVGRLREKLGDDSQNPAIIKTVRGMGYQLG